MKIFRNILIVLILLFVLNAPREVLSAEGGPYYSYLPLIQKPCVKPVLLSPENGVELDTLIPTFTFEVPACSKQVLILLEVSEGSEFSSIIGGYSSGGVLIWTLFSNLKPATAYNWRVKADCGGGVVSYSDIRSFKSGSSGEILPAPTLLSPEHNSTTSSTEIVFDWEDVSGAVAYYLVYQELGSYWMVANASVSTVTRNFQNSKTYNWYVYAKNDYALGESSPVWTFTTPDP